MASAGTVVFDAKLDTSGIKKQITQLGKIANKLDVKLNIKKTGLQKQLNDIAKNNSFYLNVNAKLNTSGLQKQLNSFSKQFTFTPNVNLNAVNNSVNNANKNAQKKGRNTKRTYDTLTSSMVNGFSSIDHIVKQVNTSTSKNNGVKTITKTISIVRENTNAYNKLWESVERTKQSIRNISNDYKTLDNIQNKTKGNIMAQIKDTNRLINSNEQIISQCKSLINNQAIRNNLTNDEINNINKQIKASENAIKTYEKQRKTLLDTYNAMNTPKTSNVDTGVKKSTDYYQKYISTLSKVKKEINTLSDNYNLLNSKQLKTSNTYKQYIDNLNKGIAATEKKIKMSKALLNDKTRNINLSDKQIKATKNEIKEANNLKKSLQATKSEMIATYRVMARQEQVANTLANAFSKTSSVIANLGSGGNLIQSMTSVGQVAGNAIANGIGIALTGNPIIGKAAGIITSSIIGILGNLANLVVNIIKGIINTSIKIIKFGIATIKKIISGLTDVIKNLPSVIEKISSKLASFSNSFKVLSASINYAKGLVSQFIGIISQKFSAYGITSFIKDSFELGSSLTEQYHILKVVTPSFVAYQDSLNKTSQYSEYMSDVTQRLGISTINATRYMAGYASMWKSLGIQSSESITSMSQDMLQLTSDLASFKDMDYDDVFKSLRSVIFGGQTRTGLNMGVDIYVDSMKKYAASVGKTWENLSGAEKSALRLEKVMRDLKFMYGDFANTSYTWANQTRLLKEQFSNLKAVIGENLIMVFNSLLIIVNKVLSAISKLAYAMNSFLKSLGLGKVLESAGANISSALGDETDALEDAADGVGGAGSNAAKEIQRSLLGFDKLMNNLSKDSDSSSSGGGSGANTTNLGAFDFGQDKDKVDEIETYMSKAIENLKLSLKKVSKFFKTLWEDFQTYFAKPFGEFLQGENGIPRLINNLAALIDGIDWNTLNVAFRRWFDSLEPLAEFIFNVGADIQEYLINPLLTFFANDVIPSVVNALADFNNAINWEKVRSGIAKVVKALEPLLETIISIKVWVFEKILLPIGEWFLNTAWPRISEALSSAFTSIKEILVAIQPYAEAFYKNFLVPVASIIGEKLIGVFENFATKLDELKTNLNDETWVHNTFGVLGDDFSQLLTDIQNWDVQAIFEDVFKIIRDVVSTANEKFGISEKFNKLLGDVINWGKDYARDTLIPKIIELWNNDIKPKLVEWFGKIWEDVQPKVYELAEKIISHLIEKVLYFISGQFLIDIPIKLAGAILDLFTKDVEDNTTSLGESIVKGLIDGFCNFISQGSIIDRIRKSIQSAVSNAIDKVSFKFNIGNSSNPNDNSPLWTNKTRNSLFGVEANKAANGAYVHATPGGQFFQVAEAGQNEVIAPEPMLRKIVREEMGNNGGFNSTQPIILQLDDGSILGQYVVNFINGEVKRTGKKLI